MDDLGVVGILGLENFERQKESCEVEFVKELGLNEWESKLCFWTIASLEFESVEETQKLETDTRIAGLTKTGKIWDFELSLSTKLDFGLEFALQIARQALEQRLLAELEEKDETFFTGADVTLDLCALGEKQEFWAEVFPNRKREWLDFKTDSAKDFWVEKLELLESFEDCRELKELTVELWEERGGKSAKLYEKEVMSLYEGFE